MGGKWGGNYPSGKWYFVDWNTETMRPARGPNTACGPMQEVRHAEEVVLLILGETLSGGPGPDADLAVLTVVQ